MWFEIKSKVELASWNKKEVKLKEVWRLDIMCVFLYWKQSKGKHATIGKARFELVKVFFS